MSNILQVAAIAVALVSIPVASLAQRPNPTEQQNAVGRNNPCADPWVSYAVSEAKTRGSVVGRAAGSGNSHECNPALYNGGRWSSFNELLGYVRQTQQALAAQNARFDVRNGSPVFVVDRLLTSNRVIGQDGAGIISNDGASFVSNDGGSIVAGGAGNYTVQNTGGAKAVFRLPNGQQLRIR